MKWIPLAGLAMLVACGGGAEGEPATEAPAGSTAAVRDDAASGAAGADRAADASRSGAPDVGGSVVTATGAHPQTPQEEVVAALISAMQGGDRERAEALHYNDPKRWSDQAGFEKRAEYYRQIDFDLDSMQTSGGVESTAVVVRGVRGGEIYVYSFLVGELDGRLQAGDLRESFVEENLGGR